MGFQKLPRPVYFCNCGDHAWSALTKGFVTLVSPEDTHFLQDRAWTAIDSKQKTRPVYARSTYLRLHREIMKAPKKLVVDHWNGNGVDNRRPNLRISTVKQNSQNSRGHRDSSSKFKGVCWVTNMEIWLSQICIDDIRTIIGYFDDEVEAAKAYDAAALKLFGPYARLNFP
jgi:hypothetical protein